jgi:hypothetical protein
MIMFLWLAGSTVPWRRARSLVGTMITLGWVDLERRLIDAVALLG